MMLPKAGYCSHADDRLESVGYLTQESIRDWFEASVPTRFSASDFDWIGLKMLQFWPCCSQMGTVGEHSAGEACLRYVTDQRIIGQES